MRIERRRKAAARQRRNGRLRVVLALACIVGAGVGGYEVGQGLAEAPGPELTTGERGLDRVTLTETVAARTITVVTRGTPGPRRSRPRAGGPFGRAAPGDIRSGLH
jgi:hypothetical protein